MGLFIYIIYLNEVLKRLRKALFTMPVEEGSSSKASAWGSSVQLQRHRSKPEIISEMFTQTVPFIATSMAKVKTIKEIR